MDNKETSLSIAEFVPAKEQILAIIERTSLVESSDIPAVHNARIELRDLRVNLTKKGKELREGAVKFQKDDTNTSFVNTAVAFAINGTNTAWNLGYRTYSVENFWIPNSAAAASIAGAIFSEVSALKEEINFSTTLVPHLNILDRVLVSYDATDFATINERWDLGDWDEMIWDSNRGDAIVLQNEAFKVLSININLDGLETRFVCRQI